VQHGGHLLRGQRERNLGRADIAGIGDDLADIDAAVPPGAAAGERYAPAQFATLDSEV
jgi:hypothetical protein